MNDLQSIPTPWLRLGASLIGSACSANRHGEVLVATTSGMEMAAVADRMGKEHS